MQLAKEGMKKLAVEIWKCTLKQYYSYFLITSISLVIARAINLISILILGEILKMHRKAIKCTWRGELQWRKSLDFVGITSGQLFRAFLVL